MCCNLFVLLFSALSHSWKRAVAKQRKLTLRLVGNEASLFGVFVYILHTSGRSWVNNMTALK